MLKLTAEEVQACKVVYLADSHYWNDEELELICE